MANKKIRNATQSSSEGITFKSQLEKSIYDTLLQQGFTPQYEPITFTLWNGFAPITPFYDKETDKQNQKRAELLGKKVPKILVKRKEKL